MIESAEVEISVKTGSEDPYLGTVLNQQGPQNCVGERSMITGEPQAASIRASDTAKCFAFELEDMPSSSILLSGKTVHAGTKQISEERIQQMNDEHGVNVCDLDAIVEESTAKRANVESQKRGSVFKPTPHFDLPSVILLSLLLTGRTIRSCRSIIVFTTRFKTCTSG